MHGIIHLELNNFVKSQYGEEALKTLLGRVRQNPDLITPLRSYPDRECAGASPGPYRRGCARCVWDRKW